MMTALMGKIVPIYFTSDHNDESYYKLPRRMFIPWQWAEVNLRG
jgi:hypothetical protein